MESNTRWYHSRCLWIELFALANVSFLAPDIYLAHMTNEFRHWAEWIPFWFSVTSPVLLAVGIAARMCSRESSLPRDGVSSAKGEDALSGSPPISLPPTRGRWGMDLWRGCGFLVGGLAVVIGVAGLLLHLESHFFRERTLDSLVYTAPFAAPLAYTGLGLLLIMNRMVPDTASEWAYWVILLALGGFIGNFIFSLADHAQNGFYHWTEWIPVAASAFAFGFLAAPFAVQVQRPFIMICIWVLAAQVIVGLLGFYFHNMANLHGPSPNLLHNIIDGAPPLAPLLFPNLALLAFIGLWVLRGELGSRPA